MLLRALVKAANVPVASTLMGLGAYPGSDPQSLGMLGMHGTYEANMAMHETDLIFALGARFDDRVTNNPDKFSPKATIVHLDVDSASVDKIVSADIALVGDAGWALNALWDAYQARDAERDADAKEKQQQDMAQWWEQIDQWRSAHGLNHNMQPSGGPEHFAPACDSNPVPRDQGRCVCDLGRRPTSNVCCPVLSF